MQNFSFLYSDLSAAHVHLGVFQTNHARKQSEEGLLVSQGSWHAWHTEGFLFRDPFPKDIILVI